MGTPLSLDAHKGDDGTEPYRVDDGVLIDPDGEVQSTTHMAHEQRDAEEGTFALRTGPAPEGYALPDTSTITIRKKAAS